MALANAADGAAAQQPCNWQQQNQSGTLADVDFRDIVALTTNFFYQTYDSPMSDATITQNISNLFASTFTFEVCSQNKSLFLTNDLAMLDNKIRMNYHSLWDIFTVPKHNVIINKITPIDPNTAQEEIGIEVWLYGPQAQGNVPPGVLDYTTAMKVTVTKDSNGKWHFKELFFIVDPPFTLASYAR
jgi:hypothetical protein